MRCVLLGVVLTLGAQLLFVLLLRTLWARRALASLDNWLQRTFGVSLQRSRSSSSISDALGRRSSSGSNGASDAYGLAGDEEGELWQQNGRAVGGNGRPLSRTGSDAGSTVSNGSSSTSASGRDWCGMVWVGVGMLALPAYACVCGLCECELVCSISSDKAGPVGQGWVDGAVG